MGCGYWLTVKAAEFYHFLLYKNEYINLLNEVCLHNDYLFVCLFVTDIIKNGTYVYYSDGAEGILGNAFGTKIFEGVYLPNVVSRKMQILPSILSVSNY